MTDDVEPPPLPPPDADGTLGDPFPRERIAVMLHRLPNYLRLAWRLGKDPMLSKARRAAVIAAAGYVVSPVDLVPGVVPVLGQLDDLAVALVALRLALDGLHPDRRRAHLEAVGLADAHLADDLRTVGATTAWIARSGLRLTGRLVREGGELTVAGAGIAARMTASTAGRARGVVGAGLSRVGRRIHGDRPDQEG